MCVHLYVLHGYTELHVVATIKDRKLICFTNVHILMLKELDSLLIVWKGGGERGRERERERESERERNHHPIPSLTFLLSKRTLLVKECLGYQLLLVYKH